MKNFKKVLALVLVVATLLSFATVASATTTKDYSDAAKVSRTQAVDVLSYIGVLNGYSDKTFRPDGEITRAEAAKIIAMFDNGSSSINGLYASANPFTDSKGHWAESFIAYCYKTGIIDGIGNLKFAPDSKVTGVQFLKMALIVLGYDAKKEGLTGASWAVNTLALAKKNGLLKGLGYKYDYAANLIREDAAQIMLNALTARVIDYGYEGKKIEFTAVTEPATKTDDNGETVTTGYITAGTASGSYVTVAGAVVTDEYLYERWGLKLEKAGYRDVFGRPGCAWYLGGTKIGQYLDTPVKTYTTRVCGCEVYDDTGLLGKDVDRVFVDGWSYADIAEAEKEDKTFVDDDTLITDANCIGQQGQLTEIYVESDNTVTIVHINTYLAQVTKVTEKKLDSRDHVVVKANIDLTMFYNGTAKYYDGTPATVNTEETLTYSKEYNKVTSGFAAGDFVLVTRAYANPEPDNARNVASIQSVELAETKNATLTSITGKYNVWNVNRAYTVGVDSADKPVACKYAYNTIFNADAVGAPYTFFFDKYGNVIGCTNKLIALNYAVVDKVYVDYVKGMPVILADLVLADGKTTKVEGVTVNKIVDVYAGETLDAADLGVFQDEDIDWINAYNWGVAYHKLMTYTVDKDGAYTLTYNPDLVGTDASIVNGTDEIFYWYQIGDESIPDNTYAAFEATDETIYLVQTVDAPEGTYVSYVGYKNVPSMTAYDIQVIKNGAGKAAIVYVRNPFVDADDLDVFVSFTDPYKYDSADGYYYWNVSVADAEGKLTAKTIVSDKTDLFEDGKGVYTVHFADDLVDNKWAVVTAAQAKTVVSCVPSSVKGYINWTAADGTVKGLDLKDYTFVDMTGAGVTATTVPTTGSFNVQFLADENGDLQVIFYFGEYTPAP